MARPYIVRRGKVTVVWKLNMETDTVDLYCIAETIGVAKSIRQQFRDEAKRYGVNPRHYVFWKEMPVVWSQSIVPDRFRIYDVTNDRVWWGSRQSTAGGEYRIFKKAQRRAEELKAEGKIGEYIIQRYNRSKRKWVICEGFKPRRKLRNLHEVPEQFKDKLSTIK